METTQRRHGLNGESDEGLTPADPTTRELVVELRNYVLKATQAALDAHAEVVAMRAEKMLIPRLLVGLAGGILVGVGIVIAKVW